MWDIKCGTYIKKITAKSLNFKFISRLRGYPFNYAVNSTALRTMRLKTPNGRDVTKRAIIDVNSIVAGRNYDILTSIIAKLLTSRPFSDLNPLRLHYMQ